MTLVLGFVAIFELAAILYLTIRKERSYSGQIQIIHTPEGMTFSLELKGDPEELEAYDEVTFKVISSGSRHRGENIS